MAKVPVNFKVFKKGSPNGKLTLYLGKRDFVDHVYKVEPVDGVFAVDQEYLQGRRVYGQLVCSFRYGSEDNEVMGLSFQKDLYLDSKQIFPPAPDFKPTKLQERLMKKLGAHSYPFTFEMPTNAPPSVTIQPGPEEEGHPCGVEYCIKLFVGDNESDRSHKRSTVQLGIRRIQYAPLKNGKQPMTIIKKDFLMSPGDLEFELTLDKQIYYHGENIAVKCVIRNHSNKTVKKIKVAVQQNCDISLLQGGTYRCVVASLDTSEGCPVSPGSALSRVLYVKPSLEVNNHCRGVALDGQDRRGVALDGHINSISTNLASSTLMGKPDSKDIFGMVISYTVKTKLFLGAIGGEVTAELPFVLMHPKPDPKLMMRDNSQASIDEALRQNSIDNQIDD